MSRRRYISTEISTNKRVRHLSDSAALLYSWMIPAAEDDATITADPEELAAIVVPNRPGWSEVKVARCVAEMEANGLLVVYEDTVYFPPSSFYEFQSNIPVDKRRTWHPEENACKTAQTAENSEKQQKTAKNSASPSPSPSPSPSLTSTSQSSEFDSFWSMYPKKTGKGQARKAWEAARRKAPPETIIAGLERLLPEILALERRFVKHPATWLNAECWADEPDQPKAPSYVPFQPPVVDISPKEKEEGLRIVREMAAGIGRPI